MGEFGVSDKEEAKRRSSPSAITNTSSNVLGLGGVKVLQQQHHTTLQEEEAFPSSSNKAMMMMMTTMVHHNHHHRPFSPFDADGPTTSLDTSLTNPHHHHTTNINSALSGGVPAPLGAVRNLQPFHNNNIISAYSPATTTSTRSAFKSPGAAGGMAASLGFPFTSAQWKELERQAMIYKYMMASVPVPPDLLIPTSLTTASSRSHLDGGFNLRLSSSTDPEPGRCRRTDGKKWRCSRDVAPNHKYCERHMHRGRPRSRKPVEVHTNTNTTTTTLNCSINSYQQIKRARHDCDPFPTSAVTVAISNPTTRRDGSSSHFFASSTQPYVESSLSLDNFGVKAANFDSVASSVSSNKEPRGLDWMLNGDPISLGASDSEWHSLMHNKVGLDAMSSCNDTQPHYLNSFALYSSGLEQNRRPAMFLNPLLVPMENLQSEKPRGFIDAWSNASTEQSNTNNNKNSVAPIGKLSLSSLDLSMGGGSVHEDIGTNEVGLGLMEHDGNTHNVNDTKTNLYNWLTPAPWVASTPGGPLAEVLRPSTVNATNDAAASNSDPSSPMMTHAESNSSPLGGTMVSSPSGVLHKALASLSDSSSNSSPTVASSRANSEIALLRFNQK